MDSRGRMMDREWLTGGETLADKSKRKPRGPVHFIKGGDLWAVYIKETRLALCATHNKDLF